jgi:Uma2 family endonuclease
MNARAAFPSAAEAHRFTVDDVRAMVAAGVLDEDARVELIGGVLLDMASEGEPHLTAKSALTFWLARKLDPARYGMIVDGTLHLAKEDAPEPDFYVYDQGVRLEPIDPARVRLVIEVANTSQERDLKLKPSLYAAYGIADYWVLDLPAGVTHVHSEPQDGDYARVSRQAFEAGLEHELFDGEPLVIAKLPFFRPSL